MRKTCKGKSCRRWREDAWCKECNYEPREIAEVVKGKWVDWLGKGNEWECSVCKCSIESHGSIAYNFCPMCGADMREREGE